MRRSSDENHLPRCAQSAAEAAAISGYLAGLTDAGLAEPLRYEVDGQQRERVRWHVLFHVVNHGTIVFDHELAKGRDDVVLAHLNHRLVQMAMRLLRAEVWSGEARKKLNRVTARVIPDHVATSPLAIVYGRLVVVGGDSYRLHEELIAAGGEISQGRFRRLNVGQVQNAIEAMTAREVSEQMRGGLAELWPGIESNVQAALAARAKERTESLQRLLDERRDKDLADITRVLEELERTIRGELAEIEKPTQQLPLPLAEFSPAEREQYRRNIDALRLRLDQIPGELAQETKGIAARYAGPQARLFPVAVMFLVPSKLAS